MLYPRVWWLTRDMFMSIRGRIIIWDLRRRCFNMFPWNESILMILLVEVIIVRVKMRYKNREEADVIGMETHFICRFHHIHHRILVIHATINRRWSIANSGIIIKHSSIFTSHTNSKSPHLSFGNWNITICIALLYRDHYITRLKKDLDIHPTLWIVCCKIKVQTN